MLFLVPTYRRHSNGEAQTFDHVPKDFPLTLVVREAEAKLYTDLLERLGRSEDSIWTIPEGSVHGIASTRQWIFDQCRKRGHSKVVMMDDDLHFIVRGKVPQNEDGWDYKLRPMETMDEWMELETWFLSALSSHAHCALSMREGNNRTPGLNVTAEATRGIRVVGYNLSMVPEDVCFRDEVEGREDLDMTLQLLRLGLPNLVSFHWAQGQRTADAPGGLQGTRTADHHDATAVRLSELHKGFVKTRTKFNKTGGMAGERTEVTVYWKKAYASSQKENI